MGKVLLIVGLVGLVIGLGVLGVSLLLPIVNAPRTSWEEAGIIPGALCSCVFFLLSAAGLVVMLTGKARPPERPRSRRAPDDF
jgi:hypothetical protein